jgi:hypothetical protein
MAQGAWQAAAPQPGQPMYMNQAPMFQVGPNGAVNLDQPMMAQAAGYPGYPGYAAAPVQMYGVPASPGMYPGGPACADPCGAQCAAPCAAPCPQPMQWVMPMQPQVPCPPQVCQPAPPPLQLSLFGEFLFMRPRDAEVAYGLPIDGPVAPVLGNEVPVGPVAVVDFEYDISFRVGGSVGLDQCNSIRAQYTRLRFDADNNLTVEAPDVIRSLVTHPLGANTASDRLDASATLDHELDIFDLDYRGLLCSCNCVYAAHYFVGAEYATFDQIFHSAFGAIGTTTVDTEIDFQGVGMRAGLEGERYIPNTGVFVYGVGNTTMLFGEFDATYVQRDEFNEIEATTAWSAGRVVPVVELEFGAGWTGPERHLRLSAGYRLSAWFNMVKTDDWINSVQNHDFRDMSDAMTFDGLVARAEWLF